MMNIGRTSERAYEVKREEEEEEEGGSYVFYVKCNTDHCCPRPEIDICGSEDIIMPR